MSLTTVLAQETPSREFAGADARHAPIAPITRSGETMPKELIIMPGGHFDAYTKGSDASSGHARDWFTRCLAA